MLQGVLNLILRKVTRIENRIFISNDIPRTASTLTVDMVNGVDVSHLPAKDAYVYALTLLDVFLTKEELGGSLVYQSPRSPKTSLDEKRMKQLLSLVEKRYTKNEWDMRVMVSKINQKCRD